MKNIISKRTFDSDIKSPHKNQLKNYFPHNLTIIGSPKYCKTPRNYDKSFVTKTNCNN